MSIFDNLQATRNEKIDLIRLALSNYTSPYKISGSDAVTLNNLSDFVSNNIIFKKRQDYSENDLSSVLYRYAYRYFTQFVTPVSTVDLMEMLILYNKYLTFNIGDNAIYNIYDIKETFTYELTLVHDALTNKNQDSSRTYSFSIPYTAGEYRDNFEKSFKLKVTQFDDNGAIININMNGEAMIINTNFELYIDDGGAIEYDLLYNGSRVAGVTLALVPTSESKSRSIEIDDSINNMVNNFESDIKNIIESMYISDDAETVLTAEGLITAEVTKDILLSNKKAQLLNTLEEIKTTNIIRNIAVGHISEYTQDTSAFNYTNNITGLNINVSAMARDAVKHIYEQIKFTGIELDELYIIFKNATNTYNASDFLASDVTTFESFLQDLFRWDDDIDVETPNWSDTNTLPIDYTKDVSRYFFISDSTDDVDDTDGFETYKLSVKETIKTHLYIYLYKYYMLMDIKTINATITAEKDKAINSYEIDQISESKPINYINTIHKISNDILSKLQSMINILKINVDGSPLDITGDKMLSFTFQYKELNEDVYDLFMQDQVETYIANWLVRNGTITSLFNNIYINNFNESAWDLASGIDITLFTLNRTEDVNYFNRAKKLTGNTINFREKEYMDIVGYHFNSFDDVYYGINSEHRQEIALYIRSFQDIREYYFKNILLKSLVNDDEYPLYEFILLVTMAFDRYFNQKVSKHKHLDSYTTEEINNFLDSFGLNELNNYDNFYGSFDYKMSVIRNYNNLIKNKGTRRVRSLIEDMLNESNNEYEVSINEYYIAKSTKESIGYVTSWYYNGNVYDWDDVDTWDVTAINLVDGEIPYRYFLTDTLYTYVDGDWATDNTIPTSNPGEDGSTTPVIGDQWFDITTPGTTDGTLYTCTTNYTWTGATEEILPLSAPPVYTYIDEDNNSISSVGYTWYDVDINTRYVYVMTPSNTTYITTEIINQTNGIPVDSPDIIGLIEYDSTKDQTIFVNVPEGTDRPITTVKNKVDSNTTIDYDKFTADDGYWSKDVTQEFINDVDSLNLNLSKTKYLSISASINMEVAKIMNMYIMTILDNLLENMQYDVSVESYADDYITMTDIKYTDLIRYIKFITSHLGDILEPSEGNVDVTVADFASLPGTGVVETLYITSDTGNTYFWDTGSSSYKQMLFFGVPKLTNLATKLATFDTELKNIISNIDTASIDEFLYDKITDIDNTPSGNIMSMNRYAYETDIDNVKTVSGSKAYLTSRLDGTLLTAKTENEFSEKLRKLLLGFGYSSVDFQNSATFILDLLESTNLISIIEIDTNSFLATKAKYLKLLDINSTSSQTISIDNLYTVNLRSLLQMLSDYTNNRMFQEDYTLKDSTVTNTLAINNTFYKILELVITTFFERTDSVYKDDDMELALTVGSGNATYDALPDFMQDFMDLLGQGTISEAEKELNLPKYNSILNSMNTILSFMTNSEEYSLLNTVNTISKNFSDAEYLNFLISLLSFFMSYKVTLYEESHQLDLSNPREAFIFAEDLLIWAELKLEEDWFFDEEIIDMEV